MSKTIIITLAISVGFELFVIYTVWHHAHWSVAFVCTEAVLMFRMEQVTNMLKRENEKKIKILEQELKSFI